MADRILRRAIRYNLFLKFFLGLGLALALPPFSQVWLAAISLSLLLLLDSQMPAESLRKRFAGGFSFGLGYFSLAFHWIGYAFLVDAESYLWMMPFAVGGLAAFMALYWGVAFVLADWGVRRGLQRWLALPAMLALVEWLRGYLFTGFPWAAPGLIADGMGGVLQLASLIGMPGLTWVILTWAMLPAAIWFNRKSMGVQLAVPVLLLLSLPAAWWWGEHRVANYPVQADSGPVVRLVQPNTAQSDKWRSENAVKIFEELVALSSTPSTQKPTVVIWPESAVPFLLDESPTALARIGAMLDEGQTLLAGSIRREFAPADCNDCAAQYFTSILTIDADGKVTNRYDKWRLVPGGEYLPLAWLLEPLGFRKVANLPESFSAGPGPAASDVPGIGQTAMLICYEAIFPHALVPQDFTLRWIVNVTNDGWFGTSAGPWQHFAQVRMRAVEQGLPVARAANTGISAVIDGVGRVSHATKLDDRTFVDASLAERLEPTVFARYGVLPGLLLVLLLNLTVVILTRKPGTFLGRR